MSTKTPEEIAGAVVEGIGLVSLELDGLSGFGTALTPHEVRAHIVEAIEADRAYRTDGTGQETDRGFRYTEVPFRDYPGTTERTFQIQESSSASAPKLWVGVNSVEADLGGVHGTQIMERAHLGVAEVRQIRDALTDWLSEVGE